MLHIGPVCVDKYDTPVVVAQLNGEIVWKRCVVQKRNDGRECACGPFGSLTWKKTVKVNFSLENRFGRKALTAYNKDQRFSAQTIENVSLNN